MTSQTCISLSDVSVLHARGSTADLHSPFQPQQLDYFISYGLISRWQGVDPVPCCYYFMLDAVRLSEGAC